jgi:hypothetical protein
MGIGRLDREEDPSRIGRSLRASAGSFRLVEQPQVLGRSG